MRLGCDVSHWQGAMDWPKAKAAGIGFAFIKASQGVSFLDPAHDDNSGGLEAVGLPYGEYHFYEPLMAAEAQARWFLKNHRGQWACLDVEKSGPITSAQYAAGVRTWLLTVEAATGKKPFVYTRKSFWDPYVHADIRDNPLWVAHYGATAPAIPYAWTDWKIWQFTSKGDGKKYGAQSMSIDLNWAKDDLLAPTGPTLAEKVDKLWAAHPELHT